MYGGPMYKVRCNGGWTMVPEKFLTSSKGKLWEELNFLGATTMRDIASFIGKSEGATRRMLTRLRAYGLVTHEKRGGRVVYRALPYSNLNCDEVAREREYQRQWKAKRKGR